MASVMYIHCKFFINIDFIEITIKIEFIVGYQHLISKTIVILSLRCPISRLIINSIFFAYVEEVYKIYLHCIYTYFYTTKNNNTK